MNQKNELAMIGFVIRVLGFTRHSDFVIRHLTLPLHFPSST